MLSQPIKYNSGALLFFKMVQDEEFTFHHDQSLDKGHFVLDIANDVNQISFSKRLYFNKQQ
jgi:hypothetical protein